MLDLLCDVAAANPKRFHVAFVFDYDVNNILRDLRWRDLAILRTQGNIRWNGYLIDHVQGKMFSVTREADKAHARVDDVFAFFRCRYDKALRKFGVGNEDQVSLVSAGKDARENFMWADIGRIRAYWGLEVTLGCRLMGQIQSMAENAGIHVKRWYGPGAFAAYSLGEHHADRYMAKQTTAVPKTGYTPVEVRLASYSAYAGGWFERFRMGMLADEDTEIHTYDINSAYVYAMSLLPDMAKGRWQHYSADSCDLSELARKVRFGVFRVEWRPDSSAYIRSAFGLPMPLFHRDSNGGITRPVVPADVWLWNPEAANASATPYARLTEAWILEDDGSYPFEWVSSMYRRRAAMKRAGEPAEKILKMTMASFYGRLAQRTGWDRTSGQAPKFHQIEMAGWVTSKCRSMIYQAAFNAAIQDALISVDTDGVITTKPISTPETALGTGLGEWEYDRYTGIIYLQNGVYWLRNPDGSWADPKLRGIPHSKLSQEAGVAALRNGGKLSVSRRIFTGYGSALHRNAPETWLTWDDQEVTIDACRAGNRVHDYRLCPLCKRMASRDGGPLDNGLHTLIPVPGSDLESKPHSVPWRGDYKARLDAELKRAMEKAAVMDAEIPADVI